MGKHIVKNVAPLLVLLALFFQMLAVACNGPESEPPACNGPESEPAESGSQLSQRVHIFYYPWYFKPGETETNPQTWKHWSDFAKNEQGCILPEYMGHEPPEYIASDFYPKLGTYSSLDREVLEQHMHWIRQAGIGVVVLSWWGENSYWGEEKEVIQRVMDAADNYGLKIAFHIEPYSWGPKRDSADKVIADIQYIYDTYGAHPAFFRLSRPTQYGPSTEPRGVFYIFDPFNEGQEALPPITNDQWKKALDELRASPYDAIVIGQTNDPERIDGFDGCHFDGIYTYDIVGHTVVQQPGNVVIVQSRDGRSFSQINEQVTGENAIFAPSVGPGYSDERVRRPYSYRDRDNGRFYDAMWQSAIDSGCEWITITSFNEWLEGTQIEPAVQKSNNNAQFDYLSYDGAYGLTGEAAELAYIIRTAYWVKQLPAITPRASVSPTSGLIGTQFVLNWSGFTRLSTLTSHLQKPDDTEFPTLSFNTDEQGRASHTIDSPELTTGTYCHWAVDDATGIKSNEVRFTISETTAGTDDWPMYRHDAGHTGYTSDMPPDELKLLWQYDFDPILSCYPSFVVSDDKVFVGKTDAVYCLDAETGALIWKANIGGAIADKALAVADGRVFLVLWVCSDNSPGSWCHGILHCLDSNTGRSLWRYEAPEGIYDMLVFGGKVFIASDGVHCFDGANGQVLWSTEWDDYGNSELAIGSDKLFCSCTVKEWDKHRITGIKSELVCLDRNTGEIIWMHELEVHSLDVSVGDYVCGYYYLTAADNRVLVTHFCFQALTEEGGQTYSLLCFDAGTGKLLWRNELDGDYGAPPVIAGGKVVFCEGAGIKCVDIDSGHLIWQHQDVNPYGLPPLIVADGLVVAGYFHGSNTCYLDVNTGQVIKEHTTGVFGYLLQAYGKVFSFACDHVQCFGASND